ncbi:PIN/TRAM domain-containing protein [Salsuginibacillus halophilus]|uniref:PIN/TRAM domain-containing protein n=1 Tax=Salsuginibacillus halophilus TaxID=517424 RepID=UPI000D0E2DE2|nr:PIN/TRAM domain-containing protein [Salsuginibacillus halophilus]
MLKRIVQLFFLLAGGTLGFVFIPEFLSLMNGDTFPAWLGNPYVGAVIGSVVIFLATFWSASYIVQFMHKIEESIVKAPVTDVLFGTLGLVFGLVVAFLVGIPLNTIQIPVLSELLPIFITFFLGYFGFKVGFKKRDELTQLIGAGKIPPKERKKGTEAVEASESDAAAGAAADKHTALPKLLDTSVIIDGRIADICQTGFVEGTLVIPEFVLEELQQIADSSDGLKRNRGRRGLDVLNRIQKEIEVNVEITDADFDDIQEVDSKLVKLAKKTGGIVVTNDFNLNKVCDLQGVAVLNINDLSNAVKPVVLPGEELHVQVIKDGKEYNQGVAYLDDGTMIVIEEGREHIGAALEVVVTSVLQTSAGRMIFAKPKLMEQAL